MANIVLGAVVDKPINITGPYIKKPMAINETLSNQALPGGFNQ
jgi:hypothetical protein